MKNRKIIDRMIWVVGSIVMLCVCYYLCRYTFFELHGMKEWPFDLWIFGLLVIVIAALVNYRMVMICNVSGYMIGFVLGMLFNTDGVDTGGARTNNWWIIWMCSYLAMIVVGVVWELVRKRIAKKDNV